MINTPAYFNGFTFYKCFINFPFTFLLIFFAEWYKI